MTKTNTRDPYRPTMSPALSWQSQVHQYPESGPLGIDWFAGELDTGVVDCLLYRNADGLVGILNYYSIDFPPYERAGNCNVFVKPSHYRQGIGTALLDEARRRWPIDLQAQRYTAMGSTFIRHYLKERAP